jgi:hypothetical protein
MSSFVGEQISAISYLHIPNRKTHRNPPLLPATRRYIFRRPKNCVQASQMISLPWAHPVLVDERSEHDELSTKGMFM